MAPLHHHLLFLLVAASAASAARQRPSMHLNTTKYTNCVDLRHLSATLQWSFDSTTSSLSFLFLAPPLTHAGWVAWAINPQAPRMLGSQALIAFRLPNGSVAANTVNVSTYHPVRFSAISYAVSCITAVEEGRELGVAATVRLPAGTERVNQVWQVGPGVTADGPLPHYFDDANVQATGVLELVGAPKPPVAHVDAHANSP